MAMRLFDVLAAEYSREAAEVAKKDREFEAEYRRTHTESCADIEVYHDIDKKQITFTNMSKVSMVNMTISEKIVDIEMSNGGTLRFALENEETGKIKSYSYPISGEAFLFINVIYCGRKITIRDGINLNVFDSEKSKFKVSYKPCDNDWISVL